MSAVDLEPVQATQPATALRALRTFVSPFTGVVHGVDETLAAPDEHRLVSIACEVADGRPTVGGVVEGYTSSEHPQREAAEAAAIGEALERYSASFVPDDVLVLATAEELPGAVDPARFALFHETQLSASDFPFRAFRSDTPVSWVAGYELPGGSPAYLPAQLVFMAWERWAAEERIAYATSSGLACAPTVEEALLAGLLELIERDAVMIAWYGRLSLPLLDWSRDPGLAALDACYFATSGLRYSAVDLSVFFGIPTVLGVVHGAPGAFGALGVGAASSPTVGVAWRKALAEAFAVQRWVRDRALEQPEDVDRPAAEIRGFDGHTMHYARPERAERAAFLDGSDERRDSREIEQLEGSNVLERLEAACSRLAERGVSAYAVDVTSPDVAGAGFRVVRVIAPELCPLDVIEQARFLGGGRLYMAAHVAGLVDRPPALGDLNPDPHPFP
ncbi:MAG TPA: YcaO-like family protein [Gaiellaceae bacterium]|nr:YcaO-like family protein [Gaiellaceae bacterium]